MLSADEVRALAADLESDRIERTLSTTDTEKFREAICAFSNDLPAHGLPGEPEYVLATMQRRP